jgi:FkbM family methyltransferase
MIVIDVGASDGQSLSIPYAQDRSCFVYAIEPIPILADQIRSQQLAKLNVSCLAIGEKEGQKKLYVNKDARTSSLLKANCTGQWSDYADQLETLETIEVPVVRLDAFMMANTITEVGLLKIDVQGYEFQVLRSAGELIHNIRRINLTVQTFPLYDESTPRAEILDYLESSGFRLVRTQAQKSGLEENLEFIRVNRYTQRPGQSDLLETYVPYIGTIVTPQHDRVGRFLEQQIFEGAEQAFLWLYLRPGDTFLDCGTHVGVYSCIAAQRLQNRGKIVGFEPNENCIELYRQNLARLNCECFTVLQVGLSDQPGTAPLFLGKTGMSAYSTFAAGAQSYEEIGDETVSVQQVRLDDVLTELKIDQVALAKLDVEGWEPSVLKGAIRSIEQGKLPVWMIEFTEENAVATGGSTKELAQLIESLGYTLCRFDATRFCLVPETRQLSYPYENLFAVLDIDQVNERIRDADLSTKLIAKNIIIGWDSATRAAESDHIVNQLYGSIETCETDIAARLEVINHLSNSLHECESDRTVQLEIIDRLRQKLNNIPEFIRMIFSHFGQ